MVNAHEIALRMTFNTVQAASLQIWACEASHMTWTDVPTRKAMQAFAEWIHYGVQMQCPHVKIAKEFGEFA